jgi:peptidoglycan/xylan/chitin deacetylase (PgdA/CDA1 family)
MSINFSKVSLPLRSYFERISTPETIAYGKLQVVPLRRLPAEEVGVIAPNSTRAICLTFDDGPDPVYTPKILAVLGDYQAKATFFVVGEAARQFPQLIEQILKAGHAIGNHTQSHQHPWLMSAARARQQVIQANQVLQDITGEAPRWFRPPFGRLRAAMQQQAQTEQLTTVLWSRSMMDWGGYGTKAGISRRLAAITAGDIVLLHDGRPDHNCPGMTYQCLPQFLRTLADKSMVARSLDEVFL